MGRFNRAASLASPRTRLEEGPSFAEAARLFPGANQFVGDPKASVHLNLETAFLEDFTP